MSVPDHPRPDPEQRTGTGGVAHPGSTEGNGATTTWPPLPLDEWAETCATLHMMTQVVGKVRLACMPWINHSWHVPLYLSSRGLTSGVMPHGERAFQIDFDLVDHALHVTTDAGSTRSIALESRPIADFYAQVMTALAELGVPVRIWPRPVEVADPIRFDEDRVHTVYEPEHAHRFWRVLWQADRVLTDFRAEFAGKCSPVHFFWGSFDLAVTRFSGRRAPRHPGGIPNLPDRIAVEAYSKECSSSGFWPGSPGVSDAAFYAYAYPEPEGYRAYPGLPEGAFYSEDLREYLLPYDIVRRAADPDALVQRFMHVTYEAAAELGGWNRSELEEVWPAEEAGGQEPAPTVPRRQE